ncbi:MAG TPA: gluconokinase [Candidatus Acidoferrales bacterium]|jgi:gluconokinase|nr:gluconokinase [Candidatus Acidoferrales bacterium]
MVVIVMGVSGAGKTTVGRALAERLGWTFEDADDWHSAANIAKMRSGHELSDEDREPWLRSLSRAIQDWVAGARNAVLACSALKASYRATLRSGAASGASIRFGYLKGTFEQIQRRLESRGGHFMPESLLRSQFETLEEPDASEAFVVDAALSVPQIVDAIIQGLRLETRE